MKQIKILFDRLKAKYLGPVYLYNARGEGWRDFQPFYLAYCKEHGYFVGSPHGYGGTVRCPWCMSTIYQMKK